MNDTSNLLRQWQLLASLSSRPGGGTVAEFAREHGVGQKTIRRDVDVLRKSGFPLEESLGDHGRKHWTLAPEASFQSLSLGWQEAISLYLCRRFMQQLDGAIEGCRVVQLVYRSERATEPVTRDVHPHGWIVRTHATIVF